MSRYFVRATVLMAIVLLSHQCGIALGGGQSCNCNQGSGEYSNLPVPEASGSVVAVPAGYPAPVQGNWQPGGYEGRIGSPYYYQESPTYGLMTSSHGYAPYGGHGYGHDRYGHDRYAAYGHADYGRHGGYGHYGNDPYTAHFGPGYYRNHEHGHYRFPYYSYRRPWYYPGHPVYNRDTNFAW